MRWVACGRALGAWAGVGARANVVVVFVNNNMIKLAIQ